MKNLNLLLLFILLGLTSLTSTQAKENINTFQWREIESLPMVNGMEQQFGLASPFVGTSNGAVIVTGGCNFPSSAVQDGGIKKYYSDIYVLPNDSKQWVTGFSMPYEFAYGASVTTPDGLLCIGGNNNEVDLDKVTLLKWNKASSKIEMESFPSLPMKLTSCAAAMVGNTIYLFGGKADGKLANVFLTLDLSQKGGTDFQWQVMPAYPGLPRPSLVVVAQNGAESVNLYLFGGFSFANDSEEPFLPTDGIVYNTVTKQWTKIAEVNPSGTKSYSLNGACGLAVGKSHILFVGGVNRDLFTDAVKKEKQGSLAKSEEDIEAFKKWRYDYLSQAAEWYNFNKEILVYNTILNEWSVGGEYPYPAPAGAQLVKVDDGWLVVNGELKPGVRSEKVYHGSLLKESKFGLVNWIVLILYLLSMLYLGYYFMKKSNSTDDFFKGGGRIPWWAVGISLFATMLSAITFMAIPAKVFATDWKYFPLAITILIMAFPVIKYYLPFFRRLNVITAYEYLEKRFNYNVRFLASSLFMIFMLARVALTLFLPSLALTTVTGIDIYLCIILMGVITLAYCTMGGAEAVIWSDVIQGVILVGGALFAVVYIATNVEGGISNMITISIEEEKFKMFDFSFVFSSATFWVILLGGLANNLISYTSDQTVIQRYISTKSEKGAAKSILLNGFLSVGILIVFYTIGTGLYAFYKTHPESLNYAMQNTDAIFPYFIMAEIPMGLAGLMIAAIFAATMSTISSNVNSLSTAFTVDMYRHFKPNTDDKGQLKVARLSGLVMGGLGISFALLMASWNILSLFDFFNYLLGLLSSGVAALFTIGIFMPKIGAKSALVGFVLGNICLIIISMYTNVSFLLYGFLGIVLTIAFSLLFRLFLRNEKDINGLTWKTIKKSED